MKIRSRFLNRCLAIIAVGVVRSLFATLRRDHRDSVRGVYCREPQGQYIYLAWHDCLLLPMFASRCYHLAGLVSRHADGGYLAEAMRLIDVAVVRGSSSRGGAQAIRRMMELVQSMHIVATPDGPRGPRRCLKPGVIFLASQTGRPIIAVGCAAANGWRIPGKWTDLLIPKPFSKIVLRASDPIHVPPNLSREQLQQVTAEIQLEMERMERVAEQSLSGEPVEAQRLDRAA